MLGGCYLIVLGFGHHPQLPQLLVQLLHVRAHTGLYRPEIVVIQLLPLGGLRPKQGAAGIQQVTAPLIQLLRDEEIFLLGAHGGGHGGDILPAHGPQKPDCLPIEGVHAAQKRGFFIQRFPGIAAKCRGDIQAVILDEGGTGGVPCGVASGLEGGTQAAAGKAAGIRLPLDELPAGKFHDHPIAGGGQEAIVLFGGDAGHGLEPVGKVGDAVVQRPGLHHIGNDIGDIGGQRLPALNDLPKAAVGIVGQAFLLHRVIKDQAAVKLRDIAHRIHSFAGAGPQKIC